MTVPLWIVLAIAGIAVIAVWACPPKGDLPKRPDSPTERRTRQPRN